MAKTNDPNRYRPGTRGHADAVARQEEATAKETETNDRQLRRQQQTKKAELIKTTKAVVITAAGRARPKTVEERMEFKAELTRRVRPLIARKFGEQPETARDRLALIASGLEPEGLPTPTGYIRLDKQGL